MRTLPGVRLAGLRLLESLQYGWPLMAQPDARWTDHLS